MGDTAFDNEQNLARLAPFVPHLTIKRYAGVSHWVAQEVPQRVATDMKAFLKANPGLAPDMLTVTCRDGRIQEARLCLSRDLAPVPCGADVVRDCTMRDALFDPLR